MRSDEWARGIWETGSGICQPWCRAVGVLPVFVNLTGKHKEVGKDTEVRNGLLASRGLLDVVERAQYAMIINTRFVAMCWMFIY